MDLSNLRKPQRASSDSTGPFGVFYFWVSLHHVLQGKKVPSIAKYTTKTKVSFNAEFTRVKAAFCEKLEVPESSVPIWVWKAYIYWLYVHNPRNLTFKELSAAKRIPCASWLFAEWFRDHESQVTSTTWSKLIDATAPKSKYSDAYQDEIADLIKNL